MSILRKLLDITKVKLLDPNNIQKSTNAYQKAYNSICSLTTKDSELPIKKICMLLQAIFFINMRPEYVDITSNIESE